MPVLETSGNRFESSDANQRLLYFDQVLSGVEAAHLQDVVHRDLKPENILYDRSHDSMVVADFGIAHFADDSLYTVVGTAANERLGSFLYAAPEQRVRGQATDARTDIYSLGLILNRLFTSEVPGGADYKTVGSVYPELGWVDDLVVEMIQQDPERRLPSIDVVKTRMVAMRQDYVVRQRLSQIRDAVVPVGEEDDPLALEPPRFVDWDWENGRLTLVLSRPVNPDWVAALRSSARNAVMGKGPGAFHFNGTKAVVQAREEEVQRVIDYFKEWLSPTTVTYRIQRARQREESAEREKAKLRAEQEELERRRRLRETIRL